MKKKLSILLVLLIAILSVAGCKSSNKPEAAVNESVESFFKAMKEFDMNKLAQLSGDDMTDELGLEQFESGDYQFVLDMLKKSAAKMTYKLIQTDLTDDVATVKISCQYIDITLLFTEISNNSVTSADELTTLVNEMLDSGEYDEFIDEELIVTVNKTDDKWIVDFDETLGNVFLSNFLTIIDDNM